MDNAVLGLQSLPRVITRHAALRYVRHVSDEIADLADRRAALWAAAAEQPALRREIRELDGTIERLWEAYRWLRGAALHGSHAQISRRARIEVELEREIAARSRAT